MDSRYVSIRSLLLALVAAAVLPLVLVAAYAIYADARQDIAQAKANVRMLANIMAASTSRTLATNREALEALAQRPLMRLVDGRRCDPILDDFSTIFPRFVNLTTIDLAGRVICSAVPLPDGKPVDLSGTDWFKRALTEKRFLAGNPFVGPITGKWVSVLTMPLYGEDGIKGFIGLPLDLSTYDPGIAAAPMAPSTRYGILSAQGRLVWRNQDPEHLMGQDLHEHDMVQKALGTEDGDYESTGTDAVHRFYAVAPVPEAGWYAFVGVPSQPIYLSAVHRAVANSLFSMIFVLAIGAFAIFLAQRIARPALALAATARQLKEGRADVRAAAEGPREVAEVAAEFNEMVDALQAAERALREANVDLEQGVAQRTAELESANKELQAFSYSVSHDLRAPLRAINGFARILIQDERARLSEDGKNMLDRVAANATKLGKLIDDILEYSRAGRQPLNRTPVDLEALVAAIAEEMRAAYPNATIETGPLPPVQGDATMLRQIFANLIGNACKFSCGNAAPRIEIGANAAKDDTVYCVKDNGVGFDMQYADKLFRVFQRLHREADFPGTGVGLSIVKQLVERHGGRVWCDATPGAGARFLFTLGASSV